MGKQTILGDKRVASTMADAHMPQLDGLRALAVGGVLWAHYLGWSRWLHTGGMGVQLFFVLSGFLITGILLKAKGKCMEGGMTRLTAFKVFYIRRSLRIFPLYYAVLIVALIVFSEVRPLWAWHLTYTSNIYVVVENKWLGPLGAFWTLCVEEQFYFVWPWLILFAPLRVVIIVIVSMLAVGPITRSLVMIFPLEWSVFTTANVDALGAGALLAVLRSPFSPVSPKTSASLAAKCIVFGVTLLCFLQLARDLLGWRTLYGIGFNSALTFLWFGVVSKASAGFTGVGGRFLACSPMVYIGKISYGIYVYHGFIPSIGRFILKHFHIHHSYLLLPLNCMLLLAVASASWQYLEKPLYRLKERVSYPES